MPIAPPEGYDPKVKYHNWATRPDLAKRPDWNYLAWLRKMYGPDATNADLTASELAYAKSLWRYKFDLTKLPQSYKKDGPRGDYMPQWSWDQRHRMEQAAFEHTQKKGIPHPGIPAAHYKLEYGNWVEFGVEGITFTEAEYLAWRAGLGPKPWL